MRKVLVVLLILAIGGVVAADRIGVRVAQNEISRQIAVQYNLPARPDVTIHGFPFLTQAIGGEYDRIEVRFGDWTQQGVTVHDAVVEMRGVQAPLSEVMAGNARNVVARTASASAVLPYSVIEKRAPKEVERISAQGDKLQVNLTGSILGFPVSGTAIVDLEATEKGIAVKPVSIGSGGARIPLDLLQRQLSWTIPVTDLPVGARISGVEPTPSGLRVTGTADNVRLGQLQQTRPAS